MGEPTSEHGKAVFEACVDASFARHVTRESDITKLFGFPDALGVASRVVAVALASAAQATPPDETTTALLRALLAIPVTFLDHEWLPFARSVAVDLAAALVAEMAAGRPGGATLACAAECRNCREWIRQRGAARSKDEKGLSLPQPPLWLREGFESFAEFAVTVEATTQQPATLGLAMLDAASSRGNGLACANVLTDAFKRGSAPTTARFLWPLSAVPFEQIVGQWQGAANGLPDLLSGARRWPSLLEATGALGGSRSFVHLEQRLWRCVSPSSASKHRNARGVLVTIPSGPYVEAFSAVPPGVSTVQTLGEAAVSAPDDDDPVLFTVMCLLSDTCAMVDSGAGHVAFADPRQLQHASSGANLGAVMAASQESLVIAALPPTGPTPTLRRSGDSIDDSAAAFTERRSIRGVATFVQGRSSAGCTLFPVAAARENAVQPHAIDRIELDATPGGSSLPPDHRCFRSESKLGTRDREVLALLEMGAPLSTVPSGLGFDVAVALKANADAFFRALSAQCSGFVTHADILREARRFSAVLGVDPMILAADSVASRGQHCVLWGLLDAIDFDWAQSPAIVDALGAQAAAAVLCAQCRRGGSWDDVVIAVQVCGALVAPSLPGNFGIVAAACLGGHIAPAATLVKALVAVCGGQTHAAVCGFLCATSAAFEWASFEETTPVVAEGWLPKARSLSRAFRQWDGNPLGALTGFTFAGPTGVRLIDAVPVAAEIRAMLRHRDAFCITDANVAGLCDALVAWEHAADERRGAAAVVDACISAVLDHPDTDIETLLRASSIERLPAGAARIGEAVLVLGTLPRGAAASLSRIGAIDVPFLQHHVPGASNPLRYPLHVLLAIALNEPLDDDLSESARRFWNGCPADGREDLLHGTSSLGSIGYDALDALPSRVWMRRSTALKVPNVGALAFSLTRCHARDPSAPEKVSLDVTARRMTLGNCLLHTSRPSTILPGLLRSVPGIDAAAVYFVYVYPSEAKASAAGNMHLTVLDNLEAHGGLALLDTSLADVVHLVAFTPQGSDLRFDGPFPAEPSMLHDDTPAGSEWRRVPSLEEGNEPFAASAASDGSSAPKGTSSWPPEAFERQLSNIGVRRYAWLDADTVAPVGGILLDIAATRGDDEPPLDFADRYMYCPAILAPGAAAAGASANTSLDDSAVQLAVAVVRSALDDPARWPELFGTAPPADVVCEFPLLRELQLLRSCPMELAVRLHCGPVLQAMLAVGDAHTLWQPPRPANEVFSHASFEQHEQWPQQLLAEAIRLLPLPPHDLRSFPAVGSATSAADILLPTSVDDDVADVTLRLRAPDDKGKCATCIMLEAVGYTPQRVTSPEEVDPIDEQRPVSNRIAFAVPTPGSRFPAGALVHLDWTNRVVLAEVFGTDEGITVPPGLSPITGSPNSAASIADNDGTPTSPLHPSRPLKHAASTGRLTAVALMSMDQGHHGADPQQPNPKNEPGSTMDNHPIPHRARFRSADVLALRGPIVAEFAEPGDIAWASADTLPGPLALQLTAFHVTAWGWLPPAYAPCANPSGALVVMTTASSGGIDAEQPHQRRVLAFALAPEVRVWEPGRATTTDAAAVLLPRLPVASRANIVRLLLEYSAKRSDDGFSLYRTSAGVDVSNLALLLQYGCEELAAAAIPAAAFGVVQCSSTTVDQALRRCKESRCALYCPERVTATDGFVSTIREDRGLSLLHWCALYGSPRLVDLVLSLGGSVGAPGGQLAATLPSTRWFHRSPLHLAAYSGSEATLKQLLLQPPLRREIDAPQSCVAETEWRPRVTEAKRLHTGPTPLHVACAFRCMNVVALLVASGADASTRAAYPQGAPGSSMGQPEKGQMDSVDSHDMLLVRQYVYSATAGRDSAAMTASLAAMARTSNIDGRLWWVGLRIAAFRLAATAMLLGLVLAFFCVLTGRELGAGDRHFDLSAVARFTDTSELDQTREAFAEYVGTTLWPAAADPSTALPQLGYAGTAKLLLVVASTCDTPVVSPFPGGNATATVVRAGTSGGPAWARIEATGAAGAMVTVRSHVTDRDHDLTDAVWISITATEEAPPNGTSSTAISSVADGVTQVFRDSAAGLPPTCGVLLVAVAVFVNAATETVLAVTAAQDVLPTGPQQPFRNVDTLPLGRLGYDATVAKHRLIAEIPLWAFVFGVVAFALYTLLMRLQQWHSAVIASRQGQGGAPRPWPRRHRAGSDGTVAFGVASAAQYAEAVVGFVWRSVLIPAIVTGVVLTILCLHVDLYVRRRIEIDALGSAVSAVATLPTPGLLTVVESMHTLRLLVGFGAVGAVLFAVASCALLPRAGPQIAQLRVLAELRVIVVLLVGVAIAFGLALGWTVSYPGIASVRSLRRGFILGMSGIINGWELDDEYSVSVDTHSYNIYFAAFNVYVTLILGIILWVVIWGAYEKDEDEAQAWWVRYVQRRYREWLLTRGSGHVVAPHADVHRSRVTGRDVSVLGTYRETALIKVSPS